MTAAPISPVAAERPFGPPALAVEVRNLTKIYGGSGKGNGGRVQAVNAGGGVQATVTLPPLATIMLEPEF